jgi:hypothetical protein
MLHVLRATACMGGGGACTGKEFQAYLCGWSLREIVPRVSYVVDVDSLICMDDQSDNRLLTIGV